MRKSVKILAGTTIVVLAAVVCLQANYISKNNAYRPQAQYVYARPIARPERAQQVAGAWVKAQPASMHPAETKDAATAGSDTWHVKRQVDSAPTAAGSASPASGGRKAPTDRATQAESADQLRAIEQRIGALKDLLNAAERIPKVKTPVGGDKQTSHLVELEIGAVQSIESFRSILAPETLRQLIASLEQQRSALAAQLEADEPFRARRGSSDKADGRFDPAPAADRVMPALKDESQDSFNDVDTLIERLMVADPKERAAKLKDFIQRSERNFAITESNIRSTNEIIERLKQVTGKLDEAGVPDMAAELQRRADGHRRQVEAWQLGLERDRRLVEKLKQRLWVTTATFPYNIGRQDDEKGNAPQATPDDVNIQHGIPLLSPKADKQPPQSEQELLAAVLNEIRGLRKEMQGIRSDLRALAKNKDANKTGATIERRGADFFIRMDGKSAGAVDPGQSEFGAPPSVQPPQSKADSSLVIPQRAAPTPATSATVGPAPEKRPTDDPNADTNAVEKPGPKSPAEDSENPEAVPARPADAPSEKNESSETPNLKTSGGLSLIAETHPVNVRVAIEPIADSLGECRLYPLVGPARLHQRRYKCTVYYDKIIRSNWPVPFTHRDESQEVVYVDNDRLISCAGPEVR